jgi:XRE family transcriptional regulator, regulator of sulfur utilization
MELRAWREKRGKTLRALAKEAGVGLATLVRLEAGAFDPRLSTLRKLAKALNVSVCALLGEEPKKGRG